MNEEEEVRGPEEGEHGGGKVEEEEGVDTMGEWDDNSSGQGTDHDE